MLIGIIPLINEYTNITKGYIAEEIEKVKTILNTLSHEVVYPMPISKIGETICRPAKITSFVYSKNIDVALILILTDKIEKVALEIIEKMHIPVMLVPASGYNALSAALEITQKFVDKEIPITTIYGEDEKALTQNLSIKIKAIEAIIRLRKTRLGLIGFPAPWLVSHVSEVSIISKRFGVTILQMSMGELVREIATIKDRNEISKVIKKIKELVNVNHIVDSKLEMLAKIYLAIKQLKKKYELDAMAIRDVEVPQLLHTTIFLPITLLCTEKILIAPEGDVHAILAMLIVYYLTGQQPFIGKISKISTEEKKILISSEMAPSQILKETEVYPSQFFTSGLSFKGTISNATEVTILSIGGHDLSRIIMTKGVTEKIEKYSMMLPPFQVSIKTNTDLERILECGIGGNVVIGFGDITKHITAFANMLKLKVVRF